MEDPNQATIDTISPSSKILVFKLDITSCNGQPLKNTELSSQDLEDIWSISLIRDLDELKGYSSTKAKNSSEIRIQFQLRKPMSIKDIAWESEFNHERTGPRGVEVLRCKVVGLGAVRQSDIGETVKIAVLLPNFDITPGQLIQWISVYGVVLENHGYTTLTE